MYIGAYLSGVGLMYLLGRGIAARKAARSGAFPLLSVLLALAALLLFHLLSLAFGLMHFGRAESWSLLPGYLYVGPAGWLALSMFVAGLFSPILAAAVVTRRRGLLS